jgi:proline iminopeptidase
MRLYISAAMGLLLSMLSLHTSTAQVKPASTGVVHTPEADIVYEQFGHDAGHTPAIVVNGGPGFLHTYLYLTDVFTKKFARDRVVTFYDQRGLGNSKLLTTSAPMGMEAQVSDLEALRAKLGYDKIDLIGHSWGGLLGMAYAAAYPQHIQHLVLIDSAAPQLSQTRFLFGEVFPDRPAETSKMESGEDDATVKANGQWLRTFLSRDFYSEEKFHQLTGHITDEEMGRIVNKDVHEAVKGAIASYDATDSLKKFSFPTLVAWGRYDMNVALLTGWNIYQAIPGAKIAIYSKSGHFPFFEEESLFLHDLNQFLSQEPTATR